MATEKPTSDWTKLEVLKGLREKAGPGGTVRALVFLAEDGDGDLVKVIQRLVETAQSKAGERTAAAIGKVHRLAKSFSIETTPEVLAALAEQPGVRSILPSEIDDIYPKPV
jgi:hypothetical protein